MAVGGRGGWWKGFLELWFVGLGVQGSGFILGLSFGGSGHFSEGCGCCKGSKVQGG